MTAGTCLSTLLAERDALDPDDSERLDDAIRAINIARNPYLVFGFGGAHTILCSALDDIVQIWNRYHPDAPLQRWHGDWFLFDLWGVNANLAR